MFKALAGLFLGPSKFSDSDAKMEKFDDVDYIITLSNGRQYVGNSTVWHSYPDGERQSTFTESSLADIAEREKWKLEQPELFELAKQIRDAHTGNQPTMADFGDEKIITFPDKSQYVGSLTVWHSFPEGERQPTSFERRLCDIMTREKWKSRDQGAPEL